MEQTVLIKGRIVVSMDDAGSVFEGDVLVRGSRIESVGRASVVASATADVTIDARGCAVLPGFVQTHIHLCQTLFRGAADDLELIDWLKRRVWPMEAAHDAASLRASARPLPGPWLEYAALDVEPLVELREALREQLVAEGKLEWATQEFQHLIDL